MEFEITKSVEIDVNSLFNDMIESVRDLIDGRNYEIYTNHGFIFFEELTKTDQIILLHVLKTMFDEEFAVLDTLIELGINREEYERMKICGEL